LDLSSSRINTLKFIEELESLEVLMIEYNNSLNFDELLKSKSLKVLVLEGLNGEQRKKIENKYGGIKILHLWDYDELEKIKETYIGSLL